MTFLQNLNPISMSVIFILLFMSVLSWYLIIVKMFKLAFTNWKANNVLKLFKKSSSLAPIIARLTLTKNKSIDSCSNLALQGINAATYHEKRATIQAETICSHSEFITRNIHRAINEEMAQLESGLTILATIGTTAPFIGLFGTVLGIYEALISISARGNASLDTVAAPVGEALIMTALGLAVAIPAVLSYNFLVHGNRSFLHRLEGFAHDLHTCLNTGDCMNMRDRVYMQQNIQSQIEEK